jgi:hypothetical protein
VAEALVGITAVILQLLVQVVEATEQIMEQLVLVTLGLTVALVEVVVALYVVGNKAVAGVVQVYLDKGVLAEAVRREVQMAVVVVLVVIMVTLAHLMALLAVGEVDMEVVVAGKACTPEAHLLPTKAPEHLALFVLSGPVTLVPSHQLM